MKTISYKLKDLDQKEKKVTLKLGYVGENEHVQIRIDCSEIWENYPNAVASLAVEPPEGSKYPAIVTREGNVVCWTVKDSDLVHDGDGRIQLTFTEGSEIQKTVICRTKVDESIVGSGTAPDPIADFVAEANEALAELEAAEVHGPVIGEDGYWYTWSKDAGEYVKTDTKAQGEDGQQGPAGKDGADGAPGQDGHTPVKGTDYWTQQDQADIVAAAAMETVSAVIDDTAGDGDTNKTWSADKIAETTGQLLTAIDGVSDDVDDLFDHETYEGGGEPVIEYEPVTQSAKVNDAHVLINGYGTANISTPSSANVIIYPVESGETYKVIGRCSTTRPLLVVADDLVTSGAIALSGGYDHQYGTSESTAVEEKEYTALRNGYLYITSSTSACGLWLKKTIIPTERKYYIDDVLKDVSDIKGNVGLLNSAVLRTKVDSSTAAVKNVPGNADSIAKVKSIADSVTLVRSIISRNLADITTVGDVEVDAEGTEKKGFKTVHLPAGNYYIILGDVGNYTMVKKVEHGVYTTLYKDQFPMRVGITDPGGGYFIVYASSIANLGDLSGVMIGLLMEDENTLSFEAYAEKTYTPEAIEADNQIEVRPYGLIEFVTANGASVASTIEYTVTGKDDKTTTRKDFITSPDGSKFLPMVKDDGTIACARVVPKKALFIGNSLTSGWQTFGEAATDSDHDFVAFFSSVVGDMESSYSFNRKWSTGFETQTSLANAQSWVTTNIDPLLSSDLDLIVVQLCENVVDNASAVATFPESSLWLMKHLRTECPKARVVWMGLWFIRKWATTLLENTAKAGCEYIDIHPLYKQENVSVIGSIYKMDSDYAKSYDVDSFTVDNGQITLVFTVDGVEYTSTIPSYTSYTSSGDTQITVTGIYHVVSTWYAYMHPGNEGFRKIANKMLFDLGISDSEETIPADA